MEQLRKENERLRRIMAIQYRANQELLRRLAQAQATLPAGTAEDPIEL